MNRLVLTAPEAAKAAEGTLTEIRRPVEYPPRFWSFMDGLDGVAHPTGYKQVHPSPEGLFIWSVDCRDPQPARTSPLGKPEDLLWVAEEWVSEDLCDDGQRVVWRADRSAAWFEGDGFSKPFYLPSDYEPEAPWQPAESMPQWASRAMLRLTAVRAERTGDVWEWVYTVEKA